MIDPSLIVAKHRLSRTFGSISEHRILRKDDAKFYVSKKFLDFLNEHKFKDELRDSLPFKYFLHGAPPSDPREILLEMKNFPDYIEEFLVSEQEYSKYKEKYEWIHTSLSKMIGKKKFFDETILGVLFDEWIFLQESSWIVARIKKPFKAFKIAGAACLEYSKKAFKRLVRTTVKKDIEEVLTKTDVLRAFGKWIAVGGTSVLSLLNPLVSALGGAIGGYFLLFDP